MVENEKIAETNILAQDELKMRIYVTAFEGLGARDYNLAEVFAELIDNSLSNNARVIQILLDKTHFLIRDDGDGADFRGVTNALNLGLLTADPTSQSVYGLGIKQIWSWAGDKITISSKKVGELAVHTVSQSYKEMKEKYVFLNDVPIDCKDTLTFIIDGEEVCTSEAHFWQLEISDLKNRTLEVTPQTMERLAQIFSPYIRKGVIITVGGQNVKKIPEAKLVFRENFSEPKFGLTGYWGIIEKGGKFGGSKYYGSDTYHNGRMISHADREILGIGDGVGCRISEHPSYYRLKCVVLFESPSILDHNKVSNKNNWIKDENYAIVQNYLYKTVTQRYKIELDKIQSQEEKLKQRLINEAISKTASPHLKDAFPEMKQPRKEYERAKKDEEDNPNVEMLDTIITTVPPIEDENSNTPTGICTGEHKPKDTHIEKRPHIPIYIGNIPYTLRIIETLAYSENDNRYLFSKDDKTHTITLEINENRKDIKGLDSSQRVPLIIEWIVEVIIRLITPNLSTTDFIDERERRLQLLKVETWYPEIEQFLKEDKKARRINRNL